MLPLPLPVELHREGVDGVHDSPQPGRARSVPIEWGASDVSSFVELLTKSVTTRGALDYNSLVPNVLAPMFAEE